MSAHVLFLSYDPIDGFAPLRPWSWDDIVRVVVGYDGMITVWQGHNHPHRILRTRNERLARDAMEIQRQIIASGASTLEEVFGVVSKYKAT